MHLHTSVCVCVLLDVCVSVGYRGSQGEYMVLWTDGKVHLCSCVFSIYFFRSPLVCLCVCVCVLACLHTPHLDRNSQMSFACGRWDPLENRIHTVPK